MKKKFSEEEKLGIVTAIAEMISFVEAVGSLDNQAISEALEDFLPEVMGRPIYWLLVSVIERLRVDPDLKLTIGEEKTIERVYGLLNGDTPVPNPASSVRFGELNHDSIRIGGEIEIEDHGDFGTVHLEPGQGTIIKALDDTKEGEEDTLKAEHELVTRVVNMLPPRFSPVLLDSHLYVRIEFSPKRFW